MANINQQTSPIFLFPVMAVRWQNDKCNPAFIFLSLGAQSMPTQAAPFSLTVQIERKGEQCIVHCTGRLVSGVCSFFIKKVYGLIPETRLIVLDFTNLECVDSMGLGALVRVYAACKRSGCELKLINLGQRVKDMLGLTNLLGIFAEMGERGSITHF